MPRCSRFGISKAGEPVQKPFQIQTCREQHVILRDLVARVRAQLNADDRPGARATLARMDTVLRRHLKLEDETLYPALMEIPELAAKARGYQHEMSGLAAAWTEFFERWPEPQIDAKAAVFQGEWNQVAKALERRMEAEDRDLYEDADRALRRR